MANACERCNGIGYGYVDDEFGWRKGDGEPCPVCSKRFDERAEKTGDFGRPPRTARAARARTAVYIDDPTRVANPDEVGQTAEEAGFAPEAVAEQEAVDIARMEAEAPSAAEEPEVKSKKGK